MMIFIRYLIYILSLPTSPFRSNIFAHSSSVATSVCRAAGVFFFAIFLPLLLSPP